MYETMYKIPFLFVLSTTLKCLLIAGSLQTSSVIYGVLKEQAGASQVKFQSPKFRSESKAYLRA